MTKDLHSINEKVLQVMNKSSMQGGPFNKQRKKTLDSFTCLENWYGLH
jgi:hypothetical protein